MNVTYPGSFNAPRTVASQYHGRLSIRSIHNVLLKDVAPRQRGTGSNRILTGVRSSLEKGQAVILLVTAMSILLFGALGLAIDGGQMYAQRQIAQAAADSAAQAGIMSIFRGTNITSSHPFGTGATPIAASPPAPSRTSGHPVYMRGTTDLEERPRIQ